jgi:acyl carrier protein phosphodiesterase
MVTHSELMKNADYEAIHSSLSGGTNGDYMRTDYRHTFTGEVVTTVELHVNEVGIDELDALYRIQRIIKDRIHELRNRPVVDEVVFE